MVVIMVFWGPWQIHWCFHMCIWVLVPMDDTPLAFIIGSFSMIDRMDLQVSMALRNFLDSQVQNGKGQCSEALSGIYGMRLKNVFFSEKSYHVKKKARNANFVFFFFFFKLTDFSCRHSFESIWFLWVSVMSAVMANHLLMFFWISLALQVQATNSVPCWHQPHADPAIPTESRWMAET